MPDRFQKERKELMQNGMSYQEAQYAVDGITIKENQDTGKKDKGKKDKI